MADITLAEFQGRVWLVGGEAFIDDLLANTLAAQVSIEIVPCERKSDVHALWVQHCGEPTSLGDPWMIHPGIVNRIRRAAARHSVFFAEWSAALDQDALVVISSVAAWSRENDDAPIELIEFLDPAGPALVAELSRLRRELIASQLAERGVPSDRIGRATRGLGEVAGGGRDSQRIDLVVSVAASKSELGHG